ncbi:MAG: ubiquinone biosynthesis protein UbiD [Deltaproteobacteria bacterium RBG_13_53_10]|nr:MAG: ubiquinone biosynthesis protein UbiD [Deltaproteobacteria bacterium RBG_13_53_10]
MQERQAEIGDLREWLAAAERLDELQLVKGADWNLEIGGISQINYRRRPNKAQLFDAIKGYPEGYRLLTASMGSVQRMAMTFNLPPIAGNQDLVEELRGKPLQWETASGKFPPHIVKSGPVLEEVYRGADINVLKFPTPLWHEKDGGRYIGTGCAVITRDPDADWVNLGAYRVMVLDEKRVTVNIEAGKHGRLHLEKWWAKEGRCPVAICLGMDPLLFAMAGLEIPTGIGEYNYAGAIRNRPVDVILSDVTGLPIPAGGEIVLEGWLYPDKQHKEGPYGEWTGYYSGGQRTAPVLEAETLLHRHDPILLGAPPGKPPSDYSYMRTVLKSAMIHDALVKAGVADTRGVWAHECGGGRMLIVVSIKQRFCGHSRQAASIAAQCQAASYMNRYVVVVDEDIDPTNLEEVMWAVCTRTDPATDIEIMRKAWGSKVDPMRREPNPTYNSRAIIDACRPYDWIDEFPAVAEASPEFIRSTMDKWRHLFSS